jgi:phosphoenolpyruvate carboxykinase (ATP)
VQQVKPVVSNYGLENHGITNVDIVYWNYTNSALFENSIRRREGVVSEGGALVVRTGHHTGRSPNDRFVVKEEATGSSIDWGKVNRPIDADKFDGLHKRMLSYLQERELYVQDCYAGADKENRLRVRVITETAWHNIFARNMFIQPQAEELEGFVPEFTVIHAPRFHAIPETDGTNSEVFIIVNFEKKLVLIGGGSYAGEIKKSIFSVLNYLLPDKGVLPMHCSANIGEDGNTAIFFGLSGTGKTTLSADASRTLIGDDEHGWGENGVFNFEGGCYAKVINLSAEAEPEIYATTNMFGTILENVVVDMESRALDLDDGSLTENTRASYPLASIPNASETGLGGQPRNIIMLTADAFGVLPPISKLSSAQAMYHFLSGYTAKVAGTEKGIKEPQATFSPCFGGPFMPRHPSVYGKMLARMMEKHGADCWLVNTGWSGGPYGVGSRMKIAHTRAMVNAALNGELAGAAMREDENFGVMVPESCPNVPEEVLNPRSTWGDKEAYDAAAKNLTRLFADNFKAFEEHVDASVIAAAIRAAE